MTIDPERAVARRLDRDIAAPTIDPKRASVPAPYQGPDGGTIYMCTADRDGMLVSLIQSNFAARVAGCACTSGGSTSTTGGRAFVLDDAHPNGIGPAKMPLHTLIPAFVLRDGRPWLVFGTEGGHGQAQTHTQVLVRMLVDGDDPQRAISAARFTIDPETGRVAIEDHFEPGLDRRPARPRARDRRRAWLPARTRDRARDRMSRPRLPSGLRPAEGGTTGL